MDSMKSFSPKLPWSGISLRKIEWIWQITSVKINIRQFPGGLSIIFPFTILQRDLQNSEGFIFTINVSPDHCSLDQKIGDLFCISPLNFNLSTLIFWHPLLPLVFFLEPMPMVEALHFQFVDTCFVYHRKTCTCLENPAIIKHHDKQQHTITYISIARSQFWRRTVQHKNSAKSLTWERAHSRTVTIRSCSGWKHMPTLPIGCGSVIDVVKFPSQSSLPKRPFHWLCRSAVFGRHQGMRSTICPVDNLT